MLWLLLNALFAITFWVLNLSLDFGVVALIQKKIFILFITEEVLVCSRRRMLLIFFFGPTWRTFKLTVVRLFVCLFVISLLEIGSFNFSDIFAQRCVTINSLECDGARFLEKKFW